MLAIAITTKSERLEFATSCCILIDFRAQRRFRNKSPAAATRGHVAVKIRH